MFSFGSKVKQKLTATRFEFTFIVHNLAPWPEGARAIAIGYQRGKRRRGATRSVYPSRQPGRIGAVVRFNERFDMPVTLYKAGSGKSVSTSAGGLGPFKKKCLILAILETDGRTQATAALGRVVVDLSEYAALEHQETRTFAVSCNKAIHAAVGDPQLMVTIRCRWKKMREGTGAVPATGLADETASMSTDTTGSRMTANLSSFLRFKWGKGGPLNEEQDLRGFESAGGHGHGGHHAGNGSSGGRGPSIPGDQQGSGLSKTMDTIQESHDEPAEPVFGAGMQGGGLTPQPSTGRSMTPQTSVKQLTPTSSVVGGQDPSPRSTLTQGPGPFAYGPGGGGPGGGGGDMAGPLEASVVGLTLREMHAARSRQQAAPPGPGAGPGGMRVDLLGSGHPTNAAAGPSGLPPHHPHHQQHQYLGGPGGLALPTPLDSATSNASLGSMGVARRGTLEDNRSFGTPTLAPAGSATSLAALGLDADLLAALRFELLTAAALEASVYLARRPPGTGLGTMGPTGVVGAGAGPRSDLAAGSFSAVSAVSSRFGGGGCAGGGGAGGGGSGVRLSHAPARRVVRTVLGMGPTDGPHFGAAALRVVRAQVASAGADGLDVLSYWWSNVVQMRAMLSCLQPAGGPAGAAAAVGGAAGGAVLVVPPPHAAAGGGILGGGPEHWAASALVPELRRLERGLFEEVVVRMWERVLLPTVMGTNNSSSGAAGGLPSARSTAGGGISARPSTAVTKRAQQEAAIKKWFEALEAVVYALGRHLGSGPCGAGGGGAASASAGGHAGLLRHQVLLQCLKRVDLLLFAHLLGGTDQPGVAELLADYDPRVAASAAAAMSSSFTGGRTSTPVLVMPPAGGGAGNGAASGGLGMLSGFPQLEDAMLPFARGVLTFGGGMSVKMTVTRLQQWAAAHPVLGGGLSGSAASAAVAATADCGAADRSDGGAAGMGAGGGGLAQLGPLFPLLRSAADLLMMPKELLLDRAVRLDMGAALSMRSVLHVLERFKPDEFAQDCISPAILQSLQDDAALPQMQLRSPAADVNSGYLPPPDGVLLRGVEGGMEPGLEYDGDSEDELDEMAQVVARSTIHVTGSSASGLGSLGLLGLSGPSFPSGHPAGPGPGASSPATRFRMLHELWLGGRTRRRGPYSVASEGPN